MDLDFDSVRTQGRPPQPVLATIVREITEADVVAISTADAGSKPAALKKIRSSHHELAKCLASGMSPGEAALLTGYSLSRVSILQSDSTFEELVNSYRGKVNEVYIDAAKRMASLHIDVVEVFHERVLENPDEISDSTLLKAMELTADRTGFGPQKQATQVNVNVDLSARLDRARLRARLNEPQVLDLPAVQTEESGA